MSDATAYPSLAHAFAALDALPIAGAMQISPDRPGVDFDALGRVRSLLPHVWGDGVVLEQLTTTPQGGITLLWRRPDGVLELVVDPYSLYAFRIDTRARFAEWTRATLAQAVADTRTALGLPPLAARSPADAAAAPAPGATDGIAGVR
jgi:hypothetical protein